ncbi:MAG: CpsD/CapB family tyrosine-protein kinase [Deltaproteobacteria bacterium]|nr:CpsD/CapB family tyrosine-protein kinase [Deltaproteobacteria bacterium]
MALKSLKYNLEQRYQKLVGNYSASLLEAKSDWQKKELYHGRVLLSDGYVQSMPVAERFRLLRTRIERRNSVGRDERVIAVSSAVPAEGKSLVAVNLARAFATDQTGKTLLIDCDLRKPSVEKYFSLGEVPGLTDALLARISLGSFAIPVSRGLDVITAGKAVEDPVKIFDDPGFNKELTVLKNKYNYIVLDCPPVLLCPEPGKLNMLADGMLMVVRGWRTERHLLKDAVDIIGKTKIIGAVINDGTDAARQYRYYRYYGQNTQNN